MFYNIRAMIKQPEQIVLLSVVGVIVLVAISLVVSLSRGAPAGEPTAGGAVSAATIPADAPGYGSSAPQRPTYAGTPTPDPAPAQGGASVPPAAGEGRYTVRAGDTLQAIARQLNVSLTQIVAANNISDPNRIAVGQVLIIPGVAPAAVPRTPAVKLIPDNELVYGPSAQGFSIDDFVPADSYLRRYSGTVEGVTLDGVQIVQLVAERTRVNPRLLLAALEHRAGWVRSSNPTGGETPMQIFNGLTGLYSQLEWAANQLNLGYYGVLEGNRSVTAISDGTVVEFAPEINAGTVGVQTWLGAHSGATYANWLQETSRDGFFATFNDMFGDPFAYTDEAFWPPAGAQPALALPWETGETWYFTGGPHGGWIAGSGWAALDFVPPGNQAGCYESTAWLTAVADGVIARSEFGAVVLDLDGDGYAGSGWAVLYQHVATANRIAVGTRVQRGDRIGHPSCEGGFSTGTHLHLARTYNGRWVAADGALPFNLGGWVSSGQGSEYNGALTRDGVRKEALVARSDSNAIRHD